MPSDPSFPKPIPHLFDSRIDHGHIVWHNDPNLERVIVDVVERANPSVFIETGTHMGWTAHWMARRFPELPILTCEVDKEYFEKSAENLSEFSGRVQINFADSREFLRGLKKNGALTAWDDVGVPFFWLDAHWWPPVPLRDECAVVASLPRYICMIDDFECKGPNFDGDVFRTEAGTVVNNGHYVADILGPAYWRPAYPSWRGCKGYGMYVKGVDYEPPAGLMKLDRLW